MAMFGSTQGSPQGTVYVPAKEAGTPTGGRPGEGVVTKPIATPTVPANNTPYV